MQQIRTYGVISNICLSYGLERSGRKKIQAYKPGSVPSKDDSYHLSSPDITIGIDRSTHIVIMTSSHAHEATIPI